MTIDNVSKSRQDALDNNQKFFFTGKACRNGHIDKRYTNTGICYECKRLQANRDYLNHKERIFKTNKKSSIKNKEKINRRSKEWCKRNKIKRLKITARYRASNRDIIRKRAREYIKIKRLDPEYRLSCAISKALWAWLKGSKAFRHWENIVGFTNKDLIKHLEVKFRDGMTWDNYGTFWHVDHIKPLSLCSSTEEAWKLDNLHPLTKLENLSKNNRYIG